MALTPNTTRSDVIVRYPSRRGAARSTLRRGARPSLGSRLSLARPHSPRTHSVNSIRGCQSTPTRGGTQPTLGPTSTHRDMTHHTNTHLKRCRRSRERSALGSTGACFHATALIVRYPSRRGAARSTLRRGARPSLGSRLSLARPHSPRTHSVNSIRGCQSTPTRGGTQPTLGPTSTHRDMTHHTNPHLKRCRRSRERSALGSTWSLFSRDRAC